MFNSRGGKELRILKGGRAKTRVARTDRIMKVRVPPAEKRIKEKR